MKDFLYICFLWLHTVYISVSAFCRIMKRLWAMTLLVTLTLTFAPAAAYIEDRSVNTYRYEVSYTDILLTPTDKR